MTTIPVYAFYDCKSLTSLVIPNSVTSIGKGALFGCSSLSYVVLPNTINSIGEQAFSGCTNLNKLYSYSEVPPTCNNKALDDINKEECILFVPKHCSNDYRVAAQWKEFSTINETNKVLVAEIELNSSDLLLEPGDTFQMDTTIKPANASDKSIMWTSSDQECVRIDENGLVTALAEGSATITAHSGDGNVEATCLVNVVVQGVSIEQVEVAEEAIEIYNLRGQRVSNRLETLPSGLYILRRGSKTTKIAI